MEPDAFKIYIDRLRDGRSQKIEGEFPPDFLEVDEETLRFKKPAKVSGEAYIAEHELVLHLTVRTEASMPCSMCNEMTSVEVELNNFYEVTPLAEVKGAIFDFRECLREEILLRIPHTAECHGGYCPAREEMTQYLRTEVPEKNDGYQPFADL